MRYLPWIACATVGLIGAPALAAGSDSAPVDAAVTTGDNFFRDAAGPAGDSTVEITPGGTVTFTSPINGTDNFSSHNVAFVDSGPQPATCNQTVQSPVYN